MTTTLRPDDVIDGYVLTAQGDGLAAGLTRALDGVALGPHSGPVRAVPRDRLPAGAAVVAHRMGAQEGVAFVRCTVLDAPADLAARLAAVRLGVTHRLLEHATEHLSTRVGGGEPLLRKQLVLGSLADLHTALTATRRLLSTAWTVGPAVVEAHDRITVLDWDVATLLGASGYVLGSPTWAGYVSRLSANCWIDRDGAPCWN